MKKEFYELFPVTWCEKHVIAASMLFTAFLELKAEKASQ